MRRLFIVLTGILAVLHVNAQQHPCLYVTDRDKAAIQQKIKTESWARLVWENTRQSIDKYVDHHQEDSSWIISRLAMYWKDGAHYTQCYLKKETWDYGEGNAPVPTVRMPGMRTWNEYMNVPLEDRIPYNETGNMKGVSKIHPEQGVTIIPYKKTGHLIRGNNVEILTMAEKAAFVYWVTGEEKYAKFAGDIFNVWLLGTYYMQPIKDPEKSSGGLGGYEPGGILGFYDYEQIHDDLQTHAALIYDLLYDYLGKHSNHIKAITDKSYSDIAAKVFKRFLEIGLVRGGKTGNWNINGFEVMLPSMLVLESDTTYSDRKGKEYYSKFYTTTTTIYHNALPDMLKQYSPVTGLWPESPGYALGTISSLLNMAIPLYKIGINSIDQNPLMQKAALAMFPWLDAKGNLVVFGDMRGGPANFTALERLLTYYTWQKDTANMKMIASVLQKGIDSKQYDRAKADWVGLCLNQPILTNGNNEPIYARAAYSDIHRHIIMKNGNDEKNGLMFTLYGGYHHEKHLSANGLALQLYGKGWALAPDASGYESYWTDDYNYHQSATGSNTILPGYTAGPITINAIEPFVDSLTFTNKYHVSDYCSFADVSAGEKRRMVAMIRSSASTGYYIDIFRSNLNDNDYLYHNLGNSLSLTDDREKTIQLVEAKDLNKTYNRAYSYFRNPSKAAVSKNLNATWTISSSKPKIAMSMWLKGEKNREVFKLVAPYSSIINAVTPNKVNTAPDSTWAIIVRQKNKNAYKTPFIAVIEPYEIKNKSLKRVTALQSLPTFTCLQVESNSLNAELKDRKETILYAIDDSTRKLLNGNLTFNGNFGVASFNTKGMLYLYIGNGKLLQHGTYSITSDKNISASLEQKNDHFVYSASDKVCIGLPLSDRKQGHKLYYKQNQQWLLVKSKEDINKQVITGEFEAGYAVEIMVK